MISLLDTISTVFGCGVAPAGSTRNFTVTGFTTLPVPMVYSTAADVPARVPGIATSEAGATRFLQRLVMQTVFDVLESQALYCDSHLHTIGMPKVRFGVTDPDSLMTMERACIIVGNTVTAVCTNMDPGMKPCTVPIDPNVRIVPVSEPHSTISGSLSTTNIIMANWSRAMWQSVLNRAVGMLATGPFGSPFFSAVATVGGS
ncbi:hypothetical protein KIN20_004343 [Parelaphostrongylus tenuis]|uniref:Uncharacterized protein n=1 Tax=Parelaphostrongylus tenuis TaxID=148309 RepID=A0AAD5MJT6_PARTN|nr:hypothetical protein KIN20_004343 [Parelaphostrongylus tenuis]